MQLNWLKIGRRLRPPTPTHTADDQPSHVLFLPAVPHAITITPVAAIGTGAAYFRVDRVPEPSTLVLMALGSLGLIRRFERRRHEITRGRAVLVDHQRLKQIRVDSDGGAIRHFKRGGASSRAAY